MNTKELFLYIRNIEEWKTKGLDVQYSIKQDDESKTVYLIFQETRSSFDWKINLLFPAKVYKKYWIHKGYIKAWKSAKDLMNEFIEKWIETNYTPVICGWSYGGAMSVLAAEEFHYLTGVKATIITYGAPKILYFRTTLKMFQDKGNYLQYVRKNDIVTWCIPFPFVHHVRKIKCAESFSIKKIMHPEITHCTYNEVIEA